MIAYPSAAAPTPNPYPSPSPQAPPLPLSPCPLSTSPIQADYISFRHHTYTMPKGAKSVELKECGPRFELKM